MQRKNIFDGDSAYSAFAQVTYKLLMQRKWVTYADVMANAKLLNSADELECNVSNCDNYGELRKAFPDICKAIKSISGNESIIYEGNNRNKRFKYVGTIQDPLADMRNAKAINNLRQYWQFCQASAGFFPSSWLEYFFQDCKDLLDIKIKRKKGEQVLSASLDRMLTNIEFLPFLYEAIAHKQVLSIAYKPYNEEERILTFHPHYLKEFNGRWHLLGHAEEHTPEYGYNLALDRICSKPRELYDVVYKSAPQNFYEDYFKDIVGVSHIMNDDGAQVYKSQPIQIRAYTYYIFKLTETKQIHHTQYVSVPFGEHKDGTYGEFIVNVELNNEFIGRILQLGDGLEIVAPTEVREVFRERVERMVKRYQNGHENS